MRNKRTPALVCSLLVAIAVVLPWQGGQAAQSAPDTTVVLVHGAFADGSSWAKVIPLLEKKGLRVVAVQNPLSSLEDDVAATLRAIAKAPGRVVLVGHSWGGAVITEAGGEGKVGALVYVASLAPDKGQSMNGMVKDLQPPPWAKTLEKDDAGFLTLPASSVRDYFAQDLSVGEQRLVTATQGPWASKCLDQPLTTAAWHTKPSWWVIPNDDRMIPPEVQEKNATQIGAHVVRAPGSHVVLLSQPRAVAEAIIDAASAVPTH